MQSWIITETATGKPILETLNPRIAAAINRDKYTVQTAREYLGALNSRTNRQTTSQERMK